MAHTPPGKTREKVFRFVRKRLLEGEPPTIREVQAAFGFSAVESARKHLEALVAEGRLVKAHGRARGYHLPRPRGARRPSALVPLIGEVQAGDLALAIESPESYLQVESRFSADDLFALTVRGDSMMGAGILAGDVLVVRRQARATTGDIVVALIGEEATVKRFWQRARRVELRPENPAYDPIVPGSDDFRILGVAVELRRKIR